MSRSTAQTEPTLIDRYQNYRTRRFLKHERTYANSLPGWRTQQPAPRPGDRLGCHVRVHVRGKRAVRVRDSSGRRCCGCRRAWSSSRCGSCCRSCSGRQGDAPQAALDEYEVQQRNTARSIGLTVTQNLMLIPIGYLIIGSVITSGADADNGLRRWPDGADRAADRRMHACDDPRLDPARSRLGGAAALGAVAPDQRVGRRVRLLGG